MVSRISSAAAFSLLCASFATGAVSQSGSGSAELPVVLTRSGYHVDVQVGGRPFATYSFDPSVAKPYLVSTSKRPRHRRDTRVSDDAG